MNTVNFNFGNKKILKSFSGYTSRVERKAREKLRGW
jgi:hypothetical protein